MADARQNEEQELEVFMQAVRLTSVSALPMAIQAAADLGIFDFLAECGRSLNPLHNLVPLGDVKPAASQVLDRLLRVLCMHDILLKSADGFYSLTPVGKHFARNENGVSLVPMIRLNHDRALQKSWSRVKDAILEGGTPFNKAHGMEVFEYLGRNGRFSQVYNTAMFNQTTIVVKNILETYNGFENLKTLVDVGGGIGVALSLIISKYPSIKGINFDLPHVIQHAPPFPGVKHVAGDMFENIPAGDAMLMKGMLRDWSDDQCVKLLKNCWNNLPENGKVIVIEQLLPPAPMLKERVLNDVLAMTLGVGGKERTSDEITQLATKAGFNNIVCMANVPWHHDIIELRKSSSSSFFESGWVMVSF